MKTNWTIRIFRLWLSTDTIGVPGYEAKLERQLRQLLAQLEEYRRPGGNKTQKPKKTNSSFFVILHQIVATP